MSTRSNTLVWQITCVLILFVGPSWEFGTLGSLLSPPPTPEPETPAPNVAITTSSPLLQAIQGPSPGQNSGSSTIPVPSHVREAMQILQNYVAQKRSETTETAPKPINAVSNDTGLFSSLFRQQNEGPNGNSLTGSSMNMLSNSSLATAFLNNSTSTLPLFNNTAGSFVGTSPQINSIGSNNAITPDLIAQLGLISMMGESEGVQLSDVVNTLRTIQNIQTGSNQEMTPAAVEVPEQRTQNLSQRNTGAGPSNINTSHPPFCPFSNTNTASNSQIQPQTGLMLPVDQPTNTGQVQNFPVGTNPAMTFARPGTNQVQSGQPFGNDPNQGIGTSNGFGMQMNLPNSQQTQQQSSRQMQNIPSMQQSAFNNPVNTQGGMLMQTAGVPPGSFQDWNNAPSQGNPMQNPSTFPNAQMLPNQQMRGYPLNQQPQNFQSLNNQANLGGSMQQQSFPNPNSQGLIQGSPGQRPSSTLMPGPTPDPLLSVFQPVFGQQLPAQAVNTAAGQGEKEKESNTASQQGASGGLIQPDTTSAMGSNSVDSTQNLNVRGNSQPGQASNIATYYQTAEGKLIRVIPYPNNQGASSPQSNRQRVQQTDRTTMTNQANNANNNQRLNPYTLQRRQLRLPSLRYTQQYPMYQRPQQSGRTRSPYQRTTNPRQFRILRYPSFQQGRATPSAMLMGQNQFTQQSSFLPRLANVASSQGQGEPSQGGKVNGEGTVKDGQGQGLTDKGSSGPIMQMSGINQLIGTPLGQQVAMQQQLASNQNIQGGNSGRFFLPQNSGMSFSMRENRV